LRVAVIGIDSLIETSAAVLHARRWWRGIGELDQRTVCRHAVGISMQRRSRVAAVIERQRSETRYGEDPKARANDRFRIVEWTVRERETRLEVTHVGVAQRLRQMILTGGDVVRAGQRSVTKVAGIE